MKKEKFVMDWKAGIRAQAAEMRRRDESRKARLDKDGKGSLSSYSGVSAVQAVKR